MKERFMRFMQGRYGLDAMSRFLMFFGLGLVLLSSLFVNYLVVQGVYALGWLVLIYSYFRVFSRNIRKRYDENMKFLAKTAGIRGFFKKEFRQLKSRKVYHIYKCPSCKQKIRVPRGKGKIEIKCPKCGTTFIKRS